MWAPHQNSCLLLVMVFFPKNYSPEVSVKKKSKQISRRISKSPRSSTLKRKNNETTDQSLNDVTLPQFVKRIKPSDVDSSKIEKQAKKSGDKCLKHKNKQDCNNECEWEGQNDVCVNRQKIFRSRISVTNCSSDPDKDKDIDNCGADITSLTSDQKSLNNAPYLEAQAIILIAERLWNKLARRSNSNLIDLSNLKPKKQLENSDFSEIKAILSSKNNGWEKVTKIVSRVALSPSGSKIQNFDEFAQKKGWTSKSLRKDADLELITKGVKNLAAKAGKSFVSFGNYIGRKLALGLDPLNYFKLSNEDMEQLMITINKIKSKKAKGRIEFPITDVIERDLKIHQQEAIKGAISEDISDLLVGKGKYLHAYIVKLSGDPLYGVIMIYPALPERKNAENTFMNELIWVIEYFDGYSWQTNPRKDEIVDMIDRIKNGYKEALNSLYSVDPTFKTLHHKRNIQHRDLQSSICDGVPVFWYLRRKIYLAEPFEVIEKEDFNNESCFQSIDLLLDLFSFK